MNGFRHFLCALSDRVIVRAPKPSSCATNDKFFARKNSFVTTGHQATIYYTRWPRIYINLQHWPFMLLLLLSLLQKKRRCTLYKNIDPLFSTGLLELKSNILSFKDRASRKL